MTGLFMLSSCADTPPIKGEGWFCSAVSGKSEPHLYANGHWATAEGAQYLAQGEALKKCLLRHRDCIIETCHLVP